MREGEAVRREGEGRAKTRCGKDGASVDDALVKIQVKPTFHCVVCNKITIDNLICVRNNGQWPMTTVPVLLHKYDQQPFQERVHQFLPKDLSSLSLRPPECLEEQLHKGKKLL